MDWLNYHHLLYFWTTAREGGITKAAKRLGLAQPTLSTQLRLLEEALGAKLLAKAGRSVALTETGRMVFRYAEDIFTLGAEMQDRVAGRVSKSAEAFLVGVVEGCSPLLVQRLLRPLATTALDVRVGGQDDLVDALAKRELDLVIATQAPEARGPVRAYGHLLGETELAWFASPALLRRHRGPFPKCLEGAPVLLPSALKPTLEAWLDAQKLHTRIEGTFQDAGQMELFGQEGMGFFPGPEVLAMDIQRQARVNRVGEGRGLALRYFAISLERHVKDARVAAVIRAAKKDLFTAR